MKYLLDTHTFLWSLFESERLSEKAKSAMLDGENEICVSTVTFWEISLKFSIGKLSLSNVVPDELPAYCRESGFEIVSFDETVASSFYLLPRVEHFDPFDRLLIWQAIRGEMIIISKDKKFKEYLPYGLRYLWH